MCLWLYKFSYLKDVSVGAFGRGVDFFLSTAEPTRMISVFRMFPLPWTVITEFKSCGVRKSHSSLLPYLLAGPRPIDGNLLGTLTCSGLHLLQKSTRTGPGAGAGLGGIFAIDRTCSTVGEGRFPHFRQVASVNFQKWLGIRNWNVEVPKGP